MKSRRTSVEVSTDTYRWSHGADPRGRGRWGFIMGKLDYDFADEVDEKGRLVVYYPTAPSGMASADLPFAMAKKFAIAEAQRRGVVLVSVAP